MPFLIPTMLHDASVGNFPVLTLKAHSGRIFMAYLEGCMKDIYNDGNCDLETQLGYMTVHNLARWYQLLETTPRRYLTLQQAEAMKSAGHSFLRVSAAVARHAAAHGILRWKLLPKHHAPSRRLKYNCLCILHINK